MAVKSVAASLNIFDSGILFHSKFLAKDIPGFLSLLFST